MLKYSKFVDRRFKLGASFGTRVFSGMYDLVRIWPVYYGESSMRIVSLISTNPECWLLIMRCNPNQPLNMQDIITIRVQIKPRPHHIWEMNIFIIIHVRWADPVTSLFWSPIHKTPSSTVCWPIRRVIWEFSGYLLNPWQSCLGVRQAKAQMACQSLSPRGEQQKASPWPETRLSHIFQLNTSMMSGINHIPQLHVMCWHWPYKPGVLTPSHKYSKFITLFGHRIGQRSLIARQTCLLYARATYPPVHVSK